MRALVTGATGYIGSRLVPVLLDAGWQVLAGARDPGKLVHFDTTAVTADTADTADTSGSSSSSGGAGTGVPALTGDTGEAGGSAGAIGVALDVTDADSCRAALSEHGPVDVAYYLVHGLGEGDFARTDAQAARTFARAAAAAGVARIVYLGGLVPEGEELSEHLASRKAVAEALIEHSGPDVEVVWLRAAIVIGAGSTSYELVRHLVDRLPVIPVPSWMGHRVQPIAADDVLHYLRHAGEPSGRGGGRDDERAGEGGPGSAGNDDQGKTAGVPAVLAPGAYDIAGPTALPYRDLVALQARVTRRRRWLVPALGVSTALASRVIAAVVPLPGHLVVDLVDSLENTMVSADDRITALVPAPPGGLTGLEEALRRAAASPRSTERVQGAGATADPLHRTSTDPDWSA